MIIEFSNINIIIFLFFKNNVKNLIFFKKNIKIIKTKNNIIKYLIKLIKFYLYI